MKSRCSQFGWLAALVALGSAGLFTACGGGGGGGGGSGTTQPLSIATSSLKTGMVNRPYSLALTATGGSPPYTWKLATGSSPVPAGLEVTTHGTVRGTPTAEGTFSFTVEVQDSSSVHHTA